MIQESLSKALKDYEQSILNRLDAFGMSLKSLEKWIYDLQDKLEKIEGYNENTKS